MSSQRQAHPSLNPYVFSERLDFISFYLPLAMAACVCLLPTSLFKNSMAFSLLAVWFSNAGHVFATIIPALLDRNRVARLRKAIWFIALVVLPGWLALGWWNFDLFKICLGYYGLFHLIMQQYGWFRILSRKTPEVTTFERVFQKLVFWNVYLVPVIYWHTGFSSVARSYFFENNLILSVSIQSWQAVHIAHWVINLLFVITVAVDFSLKRTRKFGFTFFILYSWIWFYGGIVVFKNQEFFWSVLLLTHGLAYHIHIHTYWRKPGFTGLPRWCVLENWWQFLWYGLLILIVSFCWSGMGEWMINNNFLLPLGWTFLLLHHALDSVMWRSVSHSKG